MNPSEVLHTPKLALCSIVPKRVDKTLKSSQFLNADYMPIFCNESNGFTNKCIWILLDYFKITVPQHKFSFNIFQLNEITYAVTVDRMTLTKIAVAHTVIIDRSSNHCRWQQMFEAEVKAISRDERQYWRDCSWWNPPCWLNTVLYTQSKLHYTGLRHPVYLTCRCDYF